MANFDVLGGIELTLAAAIVVATLSAALGRDTARRVGVSAALAGWFAIVVALAATGALHDRRGIGAAGLGLSVVVPIVLMWLAIMRVPSLRQRLGRAPLEALVGLHVVRVLGVSFLILWAGGRLPAPLAPSAGWGDIVAGIVAVPVAWLAHRQARGWRAALLAWNLFGLADLIVAIALGVLSSPGPLRRIFAEPGTGLMSTLPWMLVPGFLVPLLAIAHLAIFYRLAASADSRKMPDPAAPTSGGRTIALGRLSGNA